MNITFYFFLFEPMVDLIDIFKHLVRITNIYYKIQEILYLNYSIYLFLLQTNSHLHYQHYK